MIKVYRGGRGSLLGALLALPVIIFLGLPLLIVFSGLVLLFLVLGGKSLFKFQNLGKYQRQNHETSLPKLENENIGSYSIKRDARDPSVIEVL